MQIEYITRISLTAGRTTDQQGECTVRNRVLGQIVIDDQHVLSLIHKVLAHGTAGIGRDILQRACLGCSSGYNHGVIHGAVLCQSLYQISYGGTLLTDGYIDTDHVLSLLVNNGIYRNGSLTGLTVADDQLTLSASNRNHGIDGLDTGLKRLRYALSLADTGSRALNRAEGIRHNGACTVDRLSQGVYDTSNHRFSDRNGYDLAGTLYSLSLADVLIGTKQYDGHAVLFQVLGHTKAAVLKLQQLACHTVNQAAGSGNTVTNHQNRTGFILLDSIVIVFDLAADDLGDFFWF